MELTVTDADPTVGATNISKELPDQNQANKISVSVLNITPYDFISMTYYGDRAYRDGTLIRPHEREDAQAYLGRREMAFLKNFLRPVVNARIDPVFSTKILREAQDESGNAAQAPYFNAFMADCDNNGSSLGTFMENAAREANMESLCFIIMDNVPDPAATVGANMEARKFPYIYKQTRDTVLDYSTNRYGRLDWIRFFDHTEKTSDGKEVNFYRYWDAMESKLQKRVGEGKEMKWVDMEVIAHNLGVIPVFPFAFTDSRKKDCLSVDYEFYDLARCNWTIYNLDSATMEAIFDQCFSLLCIQGAKSKDVNVGTKTVCWVSPEVSNMPQFVSPNPEVARLAGEYADKIKLEIYSIAEQNGVTATKGIQEQSGKAKEWDFQAHGFILKKIAQKCAAAELWIADMFKRYTNEQFVYVSRYKEDFAIKDSDVLIAVQEKILDNEFGPEGKALAKKNIARVAFANNDEREVKVVLEEIDNEKDDELNADLSDDAEAGDTETGDSAETVAARAE